MVPTSVLFAEAYARWLLVAHTAFAVAAVASATHLVIWLRRVNAGQHGRFKATRKFAVITSALYVTAFVLGNIVYPIYKVRVRYELLDNPPAVMQEAAARRRHQLEMAARYQRDQATRAGTPAPPPAPALDDAALLEAFPDRPRDADKAARWFDTKEHWVAMGLPLILGVTAILWAWDPRRGRPDIGRIALLMAIGACAVLWLGAVIGVITASWRAVG